MTTAQDAAALVQRDRIHRRVFTDPEIFDLEMERIFSKSWVYVGHESEVSESGDYKTTYIGRQPVIISRSDDGGLHCLFNRCMHRAASVCQEKSGNSHSFRCGYHGWTYRNDGGLIGVPFPGAYGPEFSKEQFGLQRVARVSSYRGFIFASLASEGPTLEEHLGNAMPYLDMIVASSPSGDLVLRSGAQRYHYAGNWKLQLENATDGYHPAFVHQSMAEVVERRAMLEGKSARGMAAWRKKSDAVTRDLGNGHVMLDQRSAVGTDYIDRLKAAPGGAEAILALEEKFSPDVAEDWLARASGHGFNLAIFPNLVIIGVHVRVIQPVAVDQTEVTLYPMTLGDAPREINGLRLRFHEEFFGPAGFGGPDDVEIFDRLADGLKAKAVEWLLLSRGLHSEVNDGDVIVGDLSDETPIRGQYRAWQRLIADSTESMTVSLDSRTLTPILDEASS